MAKILNQSDSIEEGVPSPLFDRRLLDASEDELNAAGLRIMFGSDDPEFIHGIYRSIRPGVSKRIEPDVLVRVLCSKNMMRQIPYMYAILRVLNPEHDLVIRSQSVSDYERFRTTFSTYIKSSEEDGPRSIQIARFHLEHRDAHFYATNNYYIHDFMRRNALELKCQNMDIKLSVKMGQFNFNSESYEDDIVELYRLLLNMSRERVLIFTMPGI